MFVLRFIDYLIKAGLTIEPILKNLKDVLALINSCADLSNIVALKKLKWEPDPRLVYPMV